MVKFKLLNIGKKKPRLTLDIWNGEIRSKSMQVRVGVTLEDLDDLVDQINKIKEGLKAKESISRTCETCQHNKSLKYISLYPEKFRVFFHYFPICILNDTNECKFKETFRNWQSKEQEEDNNGKEN